MTTTRYTRRGFLATTAGAAGSLALSGLAGGPALAQAPRVLRSRLFVPLENLDPMTRTSAAEGDVMDGLFPGLITYKPGTEWGWELDAAAALEMVDATHIRFALKPGLGWTNGFGELTAEDVKFSYERIADPASKSAYRGDWEPLDSVQVTGPREGVIVLKRPFMPLMSSTMPMQSGMIVCKKAVEALEGKRFGLEPPAVAGPYKPAPGGTRMAMTLVRNEGWTGPRPVFDELRFIAITDANAAEVAYQAGEIDLTQLPMTAIPRFRARPPAGSKLVVRPALAYWWLGMQMEEGVFADKRVRQAVQYALDVEEVLQGAFFGVAERSTGVIAPGLIGARTRNLIEKPDLAKAKALLAEAGHPNGFKTDIKVRNSAEFVNVAQVVAASLAKVGIQAEVIPLDAAVNRLYTTGPKGEWKEMAMYVARFSMNPDPSWGTAWFTREQIGKWNSSRFASAEFDELNTKALSETDPAKRHQMYVRMQDLMEESGAHIFLTHGSAGILHRASFVPALSPDANRMQARKFTLA